MGLAAGGGAFRTDLVPVAMSFPAHDLTAAMPARLPDEVASRAALRRHYDTVRRETLSRTRGLTVEDQCAQAMPDASPTKWHLAHTTWFFEAVVLMPNGFHDTVRPGWHVLFNSYYESMGPRHPRPERGLLTRPPLADILAWRQDVDRAMQQLIDGVDTRAWPEVERLARIGMAHEAQHQELILTDILALFARHPQEPAVRLEAAPDSALGQGGVSPELGWHTMSPGLYRIGHDGAGLAFDNEGPAHDVMVPGFAMASRPVNGGDLIHFIEDGGYQDPQWWASDGWALAQAQDWQAPLYWAERDGQWTTLGLQGRQQVDPNEPVAHLSFHEALAVAAWAGARLPTEMEWEVWARQAGPEVWCNRPLPHGLGRVWEWTRSAYEPYPGYRPWPGALAEYNAKFMVGQQVLRGASHATPSWETRPSYRNFFPPTARWQFTGVRLARDL